MPYLTTTNGLNPSYNISLYDMSKDASYDLQNGVKYDLTVTVKWVAPTPAVPKNPLDMTSDTSRSVVYPNAIFSQAVDPILELKAYNAWEAMTLYLPETVSADMPKTGVVLSCRKSNQFGVGGTDDLDVTIAGTKFKVEYRVGSNGAWNNVTSGSITQPSSLPGDVYDNIRNASSEVVNVAASSVTNGLFSLPASAGGLGSLQPPLYFYLPEVDNIFNESKTDRVYFRVSIITSIESYYNPKTSIPKTESLFIVDRPTEYSWSSPSNTLLEPFINPLQPISTPGLTVPLTQNGVLYNAPVSSILADSKLDIIKTNKHGWGIHNTHAVNGVVPKVNLYFWSKDIVSPTAPTNVTLNDLNSGNGLGIYALIYNNANSVQLPFFIVYTNPDNITPNNSSNPVWYKSKVMFAPAPSVIPSDPTMKGLMLLYTGSLPANIPYDIPADRCVKCEYSPTYSDVNTDFRNEKINLVSIQTSSNASSTSAGDFNFNLTAVGLDGVVNNNPFKSHMNFALTLSFPIKTSEDSTYFAGATIKSTNPALGYYGEVTTSLSLDNIRIPVEVGTTMDYTVAKLYTNPNTNSSVNYLSGKTSSSYLAVSKGMPSNADYSVANTLASDGAGILYFYDNVANSLVFDLTIVSASVDRRIDGVDLFVTDNTGLLVQVASYTESNHTSLQHVVTLLSNSMNALSLTRGSTYTVTIKPYRDDNVESKVDHLYSPASDWDVTSFVYLPASPTANNIPVEYSWVAGATNEPYMTFANLGLQLVLPLNNTQSNHYAGATILWGYSPSAMGTTLNMLASDSSSSIEVNPGSEVSYTVQHSYTDAFGVVHPSSVSEVYTVNCLSMPTNADYTVANTLASDNAGILYLYDNVANSFALDLTIAVAFPITRIDGVDLFVTDNTGSLVQVANYTASSYATMQNVVTLLSNSMNALSLTSGSMYTVTLKPYRDNKVESMIDHLYSNPTQWDVTTFVYLPASPTANNIPIEYSWAAGATNEPYMTFNNSDLQLALPLNNTHTNHYAGATVNWGYNSSMGTILNMLASAALASIDVTPGSQVSYTVQHSYTDAFGVVQPGSVSDVYTVDTLKMPTKADYTVDNTLATDGSGILYLYDNVANSLVFDLTVDSASDTRRIDGVDLFVTDNTGLLIQVASYDVANYSTKQHVTTLLSNSMNVLSLTRGSTYNVVLKPYRDDNVVSINDHLYPGPTEWSLTSFVYLPSSPTANNIPVEYSWVAGAANEPYMTFNNSGLQLVLLLNNTQSNHYAGATIVWGYSSSTMVNTVNSLKGDASTSIEVNPGSQVSYTVQYNYTDAFGVVQPGAVSSIIYTVACLNMPTNSDYTISLVSDLNESTPSLDGNGNISYNTINDNSKKSIMFNLAFDQSSTNRIDGVHVYFTSSDSNISSTQIGSFTKAQAGNKEISLADISAWNDYHSATITFVPFRDTHILNAVAETENNAVGAVTSAYHIWNVPVLSQPSEGGSSIVLNGGIISGNVNTSYNTSVEWTKDSTQDFDYEVTLSGYTGGIVINGDSLLTAELPISKTSVATYTVVITKFFKGHSSGSDTIEFSSSIVDPSVMAISVLVPSGVASLKTSWVSEGVSGNAIIVSRYIKDTVSSLPLVAYSVGATRLEQSPKVYNLSTLGSNFSIGKTLELVMSVSAKVSYTLNDANVAGGSSPVDLVNGPMTKYTVSTVPNVSLSSATSTVLIQGATRSPSLLLNLDAKGLEAEGFISLVLVLTQDGTDSNPGGSEVLLQFPASPSSSNPFSFLNNVGTSTGNLVAGTPYSATPLTEAPTGFSTSTASPYVLTIGSQPSGNSSPPNPNPNGFSLSSLTFPENSGFETDPANLVNVMAILTSRRGTDIMVGSFEYVMPPVASAVSITKVNGNYFINFTLS
jgi:hypothetical protein